MSLLKDLACTSEDYWNLPNDQRAELIDGVLYDMAPPSRIHQRIVAELHYVLTNHIKANSGSCQVYPAPFAVNLNADDTTYVEPDISVIYDKSKLSDRGCEGAPDMVVEVVSPSSRKMDYNIKNALYAQAGVREYWIIDPVKNRVTVYRYEEDAMPIVLPIDQPIKVSIFPDLEINVSALIE